MRLGFKNRCKFASFPKKTIVFTRCSLAWPEEVDLLLHPLMSELPLGTAPPLRGRGTAFSFPYESSRNFPVGAREPLDLSPERWELPMHLGD